VWVTLPTQKDGSSLALLASGIKIFASVQQMKPNLQDKPLKIIFFTSNKGQVKKNVICVLPYKFVFAFNEVSKCTICVFLLRSKNRAAAAFK
jgi:hypothetical protein